MNILTWHGSVLRQDAGAEPIHGALWPLIAGPRDVEILAPQDGPDAPFRLPGDTDEWLEPAGGPRRVFWRRGPLYRGADLREGKVDFTRRGAAMWETFLLIEPGQLALLRDLLGHEWRMPAGGRMAAPALRIEPGFILGAGELLFNLSRTTLSVTATGMRLAQGTVTLELRRDAPRAKPRLIPLMRRDPAQRSPEVADAASFAAASNARLTLRGGTLTAMLPLTVDPADRDWMHRRYWRTEPVRLHQATPGLTIVKEQARFVLTGRGHEGVVLGPGGPCNEAGYLYTSVFIPGRPPLTRDGNEIYIDAAAVAAAPRLPGSYAVVLNGNLTNYYHWLIDTLLPLFLLRPHLPPGTKLLWPKTLRDIHADPANAGIVNHSATLAAWGFDDLELVEAPPPLVQVETAYFHDFSSSLDIPADTLSAIRADLLSRRPPRGAPTRIYITRRGGRAVANAADIEPIVRAHGFTIHALEGMSPAAQIDLFRDAEIVIAPHGAGMTNIIFCAPGTRILELMPQAEYRSVYAEFSDRLGLTHAILPAPTDDGGFWTNMTVDPNRLRRLLAMLLEFRVAA